MESNFFEIGVITIIAVVGIFVFLVAVRLILGPKPEKLRKEAQDIMMGGMDFENRRLMFSIYRLAQAFVRSNMDMATQDMSRQAIDILLEKFEMQIQAEPENERLQFDLQLIQGLTDHSPQLRDCLNRRPKLAQLAREQAERAAENNN